jgi:hypothetical protein
MSPSHTRPVKSAVLMAWAAVLAASAVAGPFSLISGSEQMVAVSSKVFNGYSRARLPDGSYQKETYAFGDGGLVDSGRAGIDGIGAGASGGDSGGTRRDDTIEMMHFDELSRTVSQSLAIQNYLPTPAPDSTDLLIMVYWGVTQGSAGVLQGDLKDMIDLRNAALLGFDSEGVFSQGFGDHSNMMSNILRELHAPVMDAIQVDRYYVILRAFDFRNAWRQHKIRLLWETRFSLSERLHDFGKELPGMAQYASQFYGQDTHGLMRAPVPEGHVDIGPVKSLGDVPEK